jgi:uncharacterized membrane protein
LAHSDLIQRLTGISRDLGHRGVRFMTPANPLGVILGAILFMLSLTPSLIPRSGLLQGVLGGANIALGYGIGGLLMLAWHWLGLPRVPEKQSRSLYWLSLVAGAAIIAIALGLAPHWQDLVHEAMGLPPVESVRPLTIATVALAVATLLLSLGRLFRMAKRQLSSRLTQFVPRRLAFIIGLVVTTGLFIYVAEDLIVRPAFQRMDALYAKADATGSVDRPAPLSLSRTGSPASLLDWHQIGAEGRHFVLNGPDAETIESLTGRPALDPLRVYVGMGTAPTARDRAQLALDEAIRVGAFEREILVIATPTGTGWMDPSSHFPLEVLADGNIATVGVQYSYLPSWLSLLAVSEYGSESARAVFAAVHDYWRTLPPETRPRLYLFGLSLGAMNTDLSNDVYDFIDAPYDGAFMAGPPFATRSWTSLTRDRDKGSPAWLPRFRDGKTVRFMGQGSLPTHDAQWGRTRFLYLQYGSDGISFFSPNLIWQKPDWMKGPRAPDVSPALRWVPVVTFLQVGFDLITATTAPRGHGHVYAGMDYMTGWNALLGTDRSKAELTRIAEAMQAQGL